MSPDQAKPHMKYTIFRIHRFLVDQSFYPIALSSAYALALYAGRVLGSGAWVVYFNLVWNLFLAWIPFGFSMLADGLHRLFPRQWWLLVPPGLIWLLFFPNAPYILTDFFHLEQRYGSPLWYDMLLLIVFSFTGIFLAVASLRTMQRLVSVYAGRYVGWAFAILALILGGVGIYLGRFERWNSWDMLTQPERILADLLAPMTDPLNSLRFFGFSSLFTVFLLICYLMFATMRRPDEKVISKVVD
jgi:uncharacterized membrane protein